MTTVFAAQSLLNAEDLRHRAAAAQLRASSFGDRQSELWRGSFGGFIDESGTAQNPAGAMASVRDVKEILLRGSTPKGFRGELQKEIDEWLKGVLD